MQSHETKNPGSWQASGASKHSRKITAEYTDIAYCLEDFRAYIRAEYRVSLVGELKADGHFHGLRTEEDRHGGRAFRYCVHLDFPQNIYFTDLKRGFFGLWFPQGQEPLSPAERDRLRREAEVRRVERDRQVRAFHENAAKRARALWRRSLPAVADHLYLVRKGVGAHGIRFLPIWERRVEIEGKLGQFETIRIPGVLLVPMRDGTGALWNLQAIFPEVCPALGRDKDFLPRAKKKGLFHWIGQRTATVCLAEGYATGATIHEATGYRVIVCFDAGNLVAVAPIIRARLPEARIVVCADHDPRISGGDGRAWTSPSKRRRWWMDFWPFRLSRVKTSMTGRNRSREALMHEVKQAVDNAVPIPSKPESPAKIKPVLAPLPKPSQSERPVENWPDPIPPVRDVPEIPLTILPNWVGDMAAAVAASTQTPAALAILVALAVLAAALQRRFEVAPHGDGYREPLAL